MVFLRPRRRTKNGELIIPESNVQSQIISFLNKAGIPNNRVNGAQVSVQGKNRRGNSSTRMIRCNSINGKADIEAWVYAENEDGDRIGIPLYIEVKASHGGRQSEKQKDFEEMLKSRGFFYILANSLESAYNGIVEAKEIVEKKLSGFKLNIGRLKI
jgi:hypothetical protein